MSFVEKDLDVTVVNAPLYGAKLGDHTFKEVKLILYDILCNTIDSYERLIKTVNITSLRVRESILYNILL